MELTLTGGTTLPSARKDYAVPLTHRVHQPPLPQSNKAQANAGMNQENQVAAGAVSSHHHNHNHHDDHGHHDHSNCSHSSHNTRPAAVGMITVSTLLPSEELLQRFKTNKQFRLNILSNVVRGGSFALFIDLLTALVSDGEMSEFSNGKTAVSEESAATIDISAVLQDADPTLLAQMIDGYGADGHTLAHWCAKRGDEPRFLAFLIAKSYVRNGAQLLIDLHRPSTDTVGMYPLHWAVIEGAIPLVSMLLQYLEERPSPSQRSKSGRLSSSSSSLMQDENEHTSESESIDVSNNHVGIDAQDASGCTPLLIASQYGHPDLAAFLIRRGANPNAVDSSRDTALHWAAYKGSVEVCGMLLHLLDVEGQLDAVDAFGQTPLHLASLRGNVDTVMFLMEEAESVGKNAYNLDSISSGRIGSKRSDSSRTSSNLYPGQLLVMMDKEGKTPKDLAIKKKKIGCERLLQKYEEKYLVPKRSILSRIGKICQGLFSLHNWKAWMGMSGADIPVGDSLTFPFFWMTAHILLAGVIFATQFVGLGSNKEDSSLLLDKIGLHFFFVISWIMTLCYLYLVYTTNPGILGGFADSKGGSSRDKIGLEMEAVTKELHREYDEIIESYSKDFPPQDKRVQLCHSCRIVKPLRSKHCRVTRRCVLVFDHHCPFVGTTVGLYNYIYFYLFLLSFCLMAVGFITAWITFLVRSNQFPTGIFLLGGYFAMYLIPVGFMLCYHTTLVLGNTSTNEQMNVRKYRYLWDESGRFHNPFNRGIVQNILQRVWPDRTSYDLGQQGMVGGDLNPTRYREERQSMLDNMV
jgi:palmitoyltransferase